MSTRTTRSAFLAPLVLLAAVASPAAAQNPTSETMVKVHRAKLMSARARAEDDSSRPFAPCESGNLEIGVIDAERGARVPREVTIFVEGDVINLSDGRGPYICR